MIVDLLAKFLARTSLAQKKAEKWLKASGEWIASAGWSLLAQIALNDEALPDAWFQAHLDQIEKTIHSRKNRVRHEMIGALIAIGVRSARLEKQALAVAERIGRVEVDHGQTGCQTPDAAEYIHKTLAYRKKKQAAGK